MDGLQQQATILEKGLNVWRTVLEQPVQVSRPQMIDLLNFETAVSGIVNQLKALEGKTFEEIVEARKQIVKD